MLRQEQLSLPSSNKIGRTIGRYWSLVKISFQERMVYRWNILFYTFLSILPALIAIFLWNAIYKNLNNPEAIRYITTYYVVASWVNWRVAQHQWPIMWQIKEGQLATDLLRPMSYPAKTFWYEVGGRTWSTLISFPFFIVLALAMGSNFVTPNNIFPWLFALLAFVISYVMSFFLTASLGLLTIWQNQPEGFFTLYDVASKWLGGALVPLALMPGWIGDWLQWLPFAYLYSLPVKIFMGMPFEQILQGFAVQLGWLTLSCIFFSWVWRKALDRYEVFEGK